MNDHEQILLWNTRINKMSMTNDNISVKEDNKMSKYNNLKKKF